jgi:hypothetical protein
MCFDEGEESLFKLREVQEEVICFPDDGSTATDGTPGIDEIFGIVYFSTVLALISPRTFIPAVGTFTLDIPVCEKSFT